MSDETHSQTSTSVYTIYSQLSETDENPDENMGNEFEDTWLPQQPEQSKYEPFVPKCVLLLIHHSANNVLSALYKLLCKELKGTIIAQYLNLVMLSSTLTEEQQLSIQISHPEVIFNDDKQKFDSTVLLSKILQKRYFINNCNLLSFQRNIKNELIDQSLSSSSIFFVFPPEYHVAGIGFGSIANIRKANQIAKSLKMKIIINSNIKEKIKNSFAMCGGTQSDCRKLMGAINPHCFAWAPVLANANTCDIIQDLSALFPSQTDLLLEMNVSINYSNLIMQTNKIQERKFLKSIVDLNIIIIDFEFSLGSKHYVLPYEVGAARIQKQQIVSSYQSFLEPQREFLCLVEPRGHQLKAYSNDSRKLNAQQVHEFAPEFFKFAVSASSVQMPNQRQYVSDYQQQNIDLVIAKGTDVEKKMLRQMGLDALADNIVEYDSLISCVCGMKIRVKKDHIHDTHLNEYRCVYHSANTQWHCAHNDAMYCADLLLLTINQ